MFPKEINKIIGNLSVAEITDFHRSGDKVYKIDDKYILKVSTNIQRLQNEQEKDAWISQYIVAPKPIQFVIENDVAYYLRKCLQGDNLCSAHYLSRPLILIDLLAEAIKTLHSIRVDDKKIPTRRKLYHFCAWRLLFTQYFGTR